MANHVTVLVSERASHSPTKDIAPRLVAQLRAQFYLGQLHRGDRLPAVRQLARDLRVGPTSALEIYRQLEDDGIVASRERSGVFFKSAGLENHRSPAEIALVQLLRGTARKLKLQAIDVARSERLLLRYTGDEIRSDFTFACCTCRESYEILSADLRAQVGFNLPLVHIAPEGAVHTVRDRLARDRSIRCVLSTFLQSSTAFELAKAFDLQVILVGLEPELNELLAPPKDRRRYIITRDRSCAESLRRIACSLFSERQEGTCVTALDDEECARCERRSGRSPKHLCIAALDEPERLDEIDREAAVVHVPVTAIKQVQARYGSTKSVSLLPMRLARDTTDDILREYVLGQ